MIICVCGVRYVFERVGECKQEQSMAVNNIRNKTHNDVVECAREICLGQV